jgi:hypothetical protein
MGMTTPAPKYGPTTIYGVCEVADCPSTARMTCDECGGEYCLGHADHHVHATGRDGKSAR